MPKPAELRPRWLVAQLTEWAMAADFYRGAIPASGYPPEVAWLTVHSSGKPNTWQWLTHRSAGNIGWRSFPALERALGDLHDSHKGQYVAICCHYRPWAIPACEADGWEFGTSTYYKRLHAAHAKVAEFMDRRG